MANQSILGNEYLLRARLGPATNGVKAFVTLVCLTSNGWSATETSVTSRTKCSGNWTTSSGVAKGWTMSGDGEAVPGTADTGTASFDVLFAAWKADEVFAVEMYNTNPDMDDDIIRGNVRITALEKTAPVDAYTTFTITLEGQGEPFLGPAA